MGGELKESGCEAAPPLARNAEFFFTKRYGPEIALMGSLQISAGSTLGKVVHAVGLWP